MTAQMADAGSSETLELRTRSFVIRTLSYEKFQIFDRDESQVESKTSNYDDDMK